ncbi:MAG: hypothetical protein NBV67_00920 [Tagaea sp.]|nr:hypothetical protein [Tagaea sp.]
MISDDIETVLTKLRTARRSRTFDEPSLDAAIAELLDVKERVRTIEDAIVPRGQVLAFVKPRACGKPAAARTPRASS